jgi:hypothetical protein
MAMETLEKLWSDWLQNKLENERAIGQLLQHLMILKGEVDRLKQRPPKESSEPKQ